MRLVQLSTDSYYHIYSRGVDKRKIFLHSVDYFRFIHTIKLLLLTGSATEQAKKNQGLALGKGFAHRIDILCYCLMPNHYHFLLYQKSDYGISEFMHNLNTSYTMAFNKKNHRTGRLFENTFRAKQIESDEQLLHVSRYIHLNPLLANLVNTPELYPWSSYPEYIRKLQETLCSTNQIAQQFPNQEAYKQFIMEHIPEARRQKELKIELEEAQFS